MFVFFDRNPTNTEVYASVLRGVTVRTGDVRKIITDEHPQVLVSPANCFGFMDGGIDKVYMDMFPGIQQRVQEKIKSFGIRTTLGRYVLPIGSAALVSTGVQLSGQHRGPRLLACVPTMFFPSDISSTPDNVYWAMIGLLRVSQLLPRAAVIAVPCMGTGVGKLSPLVSAQQIQRAFDDYPAVSGSLPGRVANYAYVVERMACAQTANYANKEADNLKPILRSTK